MSRKDQIDAGEFKETEKKSDQLADLLVSKLQDIGPAALSQSEKNLASYGFYDERTQSTVLPHKTIAGLAGLGWIGRHNLLVNPEFGSVLSLCTVLSDAPLPTETHAPAGHIYEECTICSDICKPHAIKGNIWKEKSTRDTMVDIRLFSACLKCLVLCPWTQNYLNHCQE